MISVLEFDEIYKVLKDIPGGRMMRLVYKTNLPVKASFIKEGWRIVKIVEQTVRTGVSYGSICANNLNESNENKENKPPKFEWILKNKLCRMISTGKDYVYITSLNENSNPKYMYKVISPDGSSIICDKIDSYKDKVIDSYFTKKPTNNKANVKTISVENIIRINNVGGDYIG